MTDTDPKGERPSFLSYLKRDKEKSKDKKSGSKSKTATSSCEYNTTYGPAQSCSPALGSSQMNPMPTKRFSRFAFVFLF